MKYPRFVALIVVWAIAMISGQSQAQAPRTISHQGLLTDGSGDPVADASRNITFRIYNVDSGGGALWTEAQSVETTNGLFDVVLGSVTPISGVSFDQELWLGITVSGEPEFAPRTPLTGAPYSFGLVRPVIDTVWIRTTDFLTDGSETLNEQLTIHALDAQIGLYSSLSGEGGSGIQLGEIFASALVDKWAMYRTAGAAQSALRFSYGPSADYEANPIMAQINENGGVEASAFEYPDPGSVRQLAVNASAFQPTFVSSAVEYTATTTQAFIGAVATAMAAPIYLPDGAVLDSLDCYVHDTSVHDLDCQVVGGFILGEDIGGTSVGVVATSSGTPGPMKITADLGGHVVNNGIRSLAVQVQPASGLWDTEESNFRIKMAVIKYRVLKAG